MAQVLASLNHLEEGLQDSVKNFLMERVYQPVLRLMQKMRVPVVILKNIQHVGYPNLTVSDVMIVQLVVFLY